MVVKDKKMDVVALQRWSNRSTSPSFRTNAASLSPPRLNKMRSVIVTATLLFLMMAFNIKSIYALDISRCGSALGMESGAIRDEDIAASSSFDGASVGPHNARVRVERNGGAWCPRQQATHQPKDWLEIDLKTDHIITAVETQGRFGNGQGQEFAEHFLLEYWRDSLAKWVRYKDSKNEEVMSGNMNTYVAEKRELDPLLIARKLRFFPYSHHRRTVCMRVEIYGCQWTEGVSSYTMPQGDQRGSGWQFFDASYDGIWDGSFLRQGLGQLTDGKLGPDNFKASYYDQDRGWVGWKKDGRNGQPIDIIFEFDSVRDFTSLSIFVNNQFTKDVQIFSEVQIHFSIGGTVYPGDPIIHRPDEDRIFENSRNASVKLHHRVGRFVKLRLFFPPEPAKWILISEVSFRSEPSTRNYTTEADGSLVGLPMPPAPPQRTNESQAGSSSGVGPVSLLPLPPVGHEVWSSSNNQPAPNDQSNNEQGSGNTGGSPHQLEEGQQAYLAVIIGVLVAVSFLLAAAIFFLVLRHRHQRQRSKNNNLSSGSPLPDKADWAINGAHQQPSPHLLIGSGRTDQLVNDDNVLLPHHPRSKIYSGKGNGTLLTIPSTYGGSQHNNLRMTAADAAASQYLLPQHNNSSSASSSAYAVDGLPPLRHQGSIMNKSGAEYQEPYHALRFSPYYSYSTLLLAGGGASSDGQQIQPTNNQRMNQIVDVSDTYDYAVPDISGRNGSSSSAVLHQPLLLNQSHPKLPSPPPPPPPSSSSTTMMAQRSQLEMDNLIIPSSFMPANVSPLPPASNLVSASSGTGSSGSSSIRLLNGKSKGNKNVVEPSSMKKLVDKTELLTDLKSRAETLIINELPTSRLYLIQRIANGAFGTVYKAEAENLPEYGSTHHQQESKKLVAAKYLPNTSEKDKTTFYQEVKLLAALDHPNLCRVLAVCTADEPFCLVLEYLDYGDLNQFLKLHRFRLGESNHVSTFSSPSHPNDDTLTMGSLIYIAGNIASGMRYLESLNFVHRDLAARNCLVGKGLEIKICDFGTDSDIYGLDYYQAEDLLPGLPIRWMAWESAIQGKYTTKSDVWSFAVTLWEILMLARQRPFQELSDETVLENLQRMATHPQDQGSHHIMQLTKPQHCPRDIYDLMCECWRRLPTERPSFREIHLFLQRKNLGYVN